MKIHFPYFRALGLCGLLSACAPGIPRSAQFASLNAAQSLERIEAAGSSVVVTPERRRELEAVNSFVNGSIEEVSDLEHFGRPDVWTLPRDGKGDCEDFALYKRKLLVDRGWPARSLSIAVGISWRGQAHAVLALATTEGELILDNLTDAILPTHATSHTLLTRQQGQRWRSATGEITSAPSVDLPVAAVVAR